VRAEFGQANILELRTAALGAEVQWSGASATKLSRETCWLTTDAEILLIVLLLG
jgi:hypothetical protein